MKNRPRHRSPASNQPTLLESLELRRLLSASIFSPTSLTLSLNWTPAATASANLTAAPDGSLWYTAGNTVEHYTSAGLTSSFALPNSADAITSLAITSDGTPWLAVTHGNTNQILRLTSTGAFTPAAPATTAPLTNLTSIGNTLWLTVGNSTLEKLSPNTTPIDRPIAGITTLNALTTDAQGNAWFAATTPIGQGLVGKLTPTGALTTFNVNADPTSIAAANGTLFFGDHNALWRIAPDGTITKTALPDITPQNLAPTPDGGIWFLSTQSASNQTAFPLNHLAPDGTLAQFSTAPQSAPNSLALTPDGTLWIMAPGALAPLRPQSPITTSDFVFANTTSQTALAYIDRIGNTITFNTGNTGTLVISTNGNSTGATTTGTTTTTTGTTTTPLLTTTTSTTQPATSTSTTTQPSTQPSTQASTQASTSTQPSTPTPPTTAPAPRFPLGDPGTFDGEFTITPHAPLPDREPTPGNSHSQSNAATPSKTILADASSSTDTAPTDTAAPTEASSPSTWFSQNPSPTLPLLAFITYPAANEIAASAPQPNALVPNAAPLTSQTSPPAVASSAQRAPEITTPIPASANADPAIPPLTTLTRWWKLAIYISSAAGIELGRGGQRYFRL